MSLEKFISLALVAILLLVGSGYAVASFMNDIDTAREHGLQQIKSR